MHNLTKLFFLLPLNPTISWEIIVAVSAGGVVGGQVWSVATISAVNRLVVLLCFFISAIGAFSDFERVVGPAIWLRAVPIHRVEVRDTDLR